MNGKDPARDYLSKLRKDDAQQFNNLKTRIQAVAKYVQYENQQTFRHVGDGIYEFKRKGYRLYAFYDDIQGQEQLIICTNGGSKNSKKEQNADIQRALRRKNEYMENLNQTDATLTITETDE